MVFAITGPLQAQFSFTERTDLLGEVTRSGAPMAVVDMNGDGRDDLIRLHETDSLLIDYQQGPGEPFSSYVYGELPRGSIWAVCAADVDRNGFNDLFLGPSSGGAFLLKADAAGTKYNFVELPDRDIFVQGSIFGDFDNDGNIDLFACDDNDDNHRYRNDGAGEFVLAPDLVGASLPSSVSSGNYAAILTDYDNDGHSDMYLSKCRLGVTDRTDRRRINRLFRNDGTNSYTDEGPAVGLDDGEQSWCADFGDIDNDGDMDCFILNHGQGTSKLLENDGSGFFTDISASAGLAGINYFGIQALFRDFDNDTFVDLLVTATNLGGSAATYRLYRNNGDKSFTRIPNVLRINNGGALISHLHSCAVGDFNQDGFVDILGGRGTGYNGHSDDQRDLMFLNDGNANHFLGVQVRGRVSNPNGIGTRLELHGDWGVQLREVRAGEGYGIQNSLTKIFGLGSTTEIKKLVVKWPSGVVEEILEPTADQLLRISEGDTWESGNFSEPDISSPLAVHVIVDEPLRYRVATSNLSLSYAIADGPAGMTIDQESGILTWTPSAEGVETVDIKASNPAGVSTETLVITVALAPPPPDFASAVNNADLGFSTSETPWFVQERESRGDGQALQSGAVGDDGRSYLESEVEGPGELQFWWKASSEQNFDELVFRVDGTRVEDISGETGWRLVSYEVPEGTHRLRWSYEKDGSVADNDDAGYLDEISWAAADGDGDGLPDDWERANFGDLSAGPDDDPDGDLSSNVEEWAAATDPNDSASMLQILRVTREVNGGSEVVFRSVPGKKYVIEASDTLQDFRRVTEEITAGTDATTATVVLYAPGSVEEVTYVASDAAGKVLVPNGPLNGLWRGGDETGFAAGGGDAGWSTVTQGIGYDQNQTTYDPFIGSDLQAVMYRNHPTACLRLPFNVDNPAVVTSLVMELRYDDGFAAWLNGVPVAGDNLPNGSLSWNSSAPSSRPDSRAVDFNAFDLGDNVSNLQAGRNILALQGLNRSSTNRDFLLQARLRGEEGELLMPSGYYFRVRVVE
ncbi:MAG: FG-GAP-like repeat-containing protein [Roseibacillus sp.]|nr:FG-GAP-like repeat-containing protein [Roseibacillus sp.]